MLSARWLMSFLVCLLMISSSIAQDAAQPLVLVKANTDYGEMGDLWEWTGGATLRQKTQWGFNEALRLSPLNDEIAYHSWSRVVVESIMASSMPSGGRFPGNIWVIANNSSDRGTRLADQPADASFHTDRVPDKGFIRGNPTWSPDGTKIAWAERLDLGYEGSEPYRLVVYDRAAQTTRTLVEDLPAQHGIDGGLDVYWIGDSLVVDSLTELGPDERSVIVFDANTGEQRLNVFASSIIDGESFFPEIITAIQYQGKTWLGLLHTFKDKDAQWHLIDLETGEVIVPPSTPVAVAANQPETSLRVRVDGPSPRFYVFYTLMAADGTPLPLNLKEGEAIRDFALSPDGQAIAYQIYNPEGRSEEAPLFVWRDGAVTQVPETEAPAVVSDFVWGTAEWIIEESAGQ